VDYFEGDNENEGLDDVPNSNEDDEHLVEGQAQTREQEDDVLAMPPLQVEDVLFDVLGEGNGRNEDPLSFGFNLKNLH